LCVVDEVTRGKPRNIAVRIAGNPAEMEPVPSRKQI